jgi:CRISPR/Cas system CSM-associated protein Csm3 (group 7 of RAMP superfamily)
LTARTDKEFQMARDRNRRQPPAPKPYTLVDFPSDTHIERQMPIGHDTFRKDLLSGWIDLELEALSPVHVASGLWKLVQGTRPSMVRELVRVNGTPVIPGSSLKGCVRAIVEAISPACVRATESRDIPIPCGLRGCASKEHLCIACRIFGAQNFQGLIRFSDFRLIEGVVEIAEVPQLFQPRPREGLYFRGRFVRGRKFYMHGAKQAQGTGQIEVCRSGSRFRGRLDVTNLSEAQLGLVLSGLGLDPQHTFRPKLGGAKPACYGSIQPRILRINIASPQQDYLDWDRTSDINADPDRLIAAARSLVLEPQLAAVAETLRWPNERECPSGNY